MPNAVEQVVHYLHRSLSFGQEEWVRAPDLAFPGQLVWASKAEAEALAEKYEWYGYTTRTEEAPDGYEVWWSTSVAEDVPIPEPADHAEEPTPPAH